MHNGPDSAGMVDVPYVCGESWWAALEGVMGAINCPDCREHGLELLSAMHDLVNDRTGKPLFNHSNFLQVAREYTDVAAKHAGHAQAPASGFDWARWLVDNKQETLEELYERTKGFAGRQETEPPKVTISGTCNEDRDCTINVSAKTQVKTKVDEPGDVETAIDKVLDQLAVKDGPGPGPGPGPAGAGVTSPFVIELAGRQFPFDPVTLKNMVKMADQTTKREQGFSLCTAVDGNGNPIGALHTGALCQGGKCSVRLGGCGVVPAGESRKVIGFFHTHPDDDFDVAARQNTFSVQDLMLAREGHVACVGGNKAGQIICASLKPGERAVVTGGRSYPYIHPAMAERTKEWLRSSPKMFRPNVGARFDFIQLDKAVLKDLWGDSPLPDVIPPKPETKPRVRKDAPRVTDKDELQKRSDFAIRELPEGSALGIGDARGSFTRSLMVRYFSEYPEARDGIARTVRSLQRGSPTIPVVKEAMGRLYDAWANSREDRIRFGNTLVPAWAKKKPVDNLATQLAAKRVRIDSLPVGQWFKLPEKTTVWQIVEIDGKVKAKDVDSPKEKSFPPCTKVVDLGGQQLPLHRLRISKAAFIRQAAKAILKTCDLDSPAKLFDHASQWLTEAFIKGRIEGERGGFDGQQNKVSISGRCDGRENCDVKVTASTHASTRTNAGGINEAVAQVLREMAAKTQAGGSPLTFAMGSNGTTRYEFEFRIVPAATLIPSHDPFTFEPLAGYPSELQPRLRERAATQLQVNKIAANLDPEALLTDFRTLDRGAPITGDDLVVESGNGRTMAILQAIQSYPQAYGEYVDRLHDVAPLLGLTTEGVENPVLVRVRLTEVDRKAFAEEANTSAAISSSAIEKARADAGRITSAMLSGLQVGESQTLEDALRSNSNRLFTSQFLGKLPENDKAALVDKDGRINSDAVRRMLMAIFVSALGATDSGLRFAEIAFENVNEQVRNVVNGVSRHLGKLASAEQLIADGRRPAELSIGNDLAHVAQVFAGIKATPGMTVAMYLNQGQMFERELSDFEEKILFAIEERSRSAKKIAGIVGRYADAVLAQPEPGQTSFIDLEPVTKESLWDAAVAGSDQEDQTRPLFGLELGELGELGDRLSLPADASFSEIMEALAPLGKTLPACSPNQGAKVERCIEKLQGDPSVNPWAICQSSLKCSISQALELLFTDDEGEHQFVITTNPRTADAITEALKKEKVPA